MKFVTFIEQNQEKLGFLIGAPGSEKVVDAAAALKASGTDPGSLDILKLLREQSKWMPALQKLAREPSVHRHSGPPSRCTTPASSPPSRTRPRCATATPFASTSKPRAAIAGSR